MDYRRCLFVEDFSNVNGPLIWSCREPKRYVQLSRAVQVYTGFLTGTSSRSIIDEKVCRVSGMSRLDGKGRLRDGVVG